MTRLHEILGIAYAALGSLTFGYALSTGSTIIGLQGFIKYYDIDTFGSNASYANSIQGALNGIFFAGGAFGAVGQGWIADRYGRRRALQVTCAIMMIATVLLTASVHVGMFLAGRLLQGFAAGMLNTICPVYQSEIAPASHRGALVGMHGFTFVMGQAIVTWVGVGCFDMANQQVAWRLLCGLQAVPTVALAVGTLVMLESPRWLIAHGHHESALTALRKFNGKGFSTEEDEHIAKTSFASIHSQIDLDAHHTTTLVGMLRHLPSRRRLLTGFACMAVNQCTGQTVVWSYQVNLLLGLGVDGNGPLLVLAGFMTLGALCNGGGGFVLDRLGRRKTYLVGLVGVISTLAVHTAMVARYSGTSNRAGQGTGIAMLFVYVTFFAGCIDVTTYVYCSEIFPTVQRAHGMAYSVSFFFCLCALWTSIAPVVMARISWGYYCVFIGLSVISFIGIYFKFPETSHKTLEEIGQLFGDTIAHDAANADGEDILMEGTGSQVDEKVDVQHMEVVRV